MGKILKTSIYIIMLVVSFMLSSCVDDIDDSPTVITGQVIDYYTKKPVTDYKIILVYTKSGFGGSISGEIDSIKVDSLGKFYYSFTATNGCKYDIMAYSTKYEGLSSHELNYETNNQFDLTVKPLKCISLILNNKTGKYKRFCISYFPLGGDQPATFKDTTIIIKSVVPDSYHKLKIDLYECESCGTFITKSENIWIENVDTTYLKREY
jgi:hypothetical protein